MLGEKFQSPIRAKSRAPSKRNGYPVKLAEAMVSPDTGVYEVIRIEQNWSETMVRFIGSIAPILMMIGLAALYMEMKAPGFGVPGIIGIICLAIVFLNQYMVGLADYTELLVIGFGLVLMGIEVFVLPGFGVAGFAGIVCLAVGLILSLQGFVLPDPSIPWQLDILVNNVSQVVGALIVSFLVGLFFCGMCSRNFLLPARDRFWRRI